MDDSLITEVERLARLIGASYGRLESLVFARSDAVLSRPWSDGGNAAAVLDSCAVDVRALATSVARAASAPAPAQGRTGRWYQPATTSCPITSGGTEPPGT